MRDRFLKNFFSLVLCGGLATCPLTGCGPSSSSPEDPVGDSTPGGKTKTSVNNSAADKPLSIDSFGENPNLDRNDTAGGERFPRVEGMQPIAESPPMDGTEEPAAEQPPEWTAEELQELGIQKFESERLRLLADQVSENERGQYEALPSVLDAFFAWVEEEYPQFLDGAAGPAWQWTGYVMQEPALFRQADMLPEDIADLTHGKDQGRQFWIVEQPTDYYRRHLILHEATHCLMNERFHQWPVWYLEGMAELVACHHWNENGQASFAVTPGNEHTTGGFGRLALIRSETEAGRFQTLDDVMRLNFGNFYPHKTSYAWSWACCYFLSHHPLTAEPFHRLAGIRTNPEFDRTLEQILQQDRTRLNLDWAAFAGSLIPGFDFPRMLTTPPTGSESQGPWTLQVERSWQASPFLVKQGETFGVTASGQFSLASQPEPWTSEPWGISLDYSDGRPLGELQLAIVPDRNTPAHGKALTTPQPVGGKWQGKATDSGRLYFRINDRANNWANNAGEVKIEFQTGSAVTGSDAN